MLVKLLNTNLIRTFGGVIVEMSDSQAARYIDKKEAMVYNKSIKKNRYGNKAVKGPSENKMVWNSPENKLFDDNDNVESLNKDPFPGPEDSLFPQQII